jgi:hypothetical protein
MLEISKILGSLKKLSPRIQNLGVELATQQVVSLVNLSNNIF